MVFNSIIIFVLVIVLMAFAVFIGLALGNVFARDKPVTNKEVCDFIKCNEDMTKWIKEQRGDIEKSSKQFAGCKACPERSYSQLTNEVQKYNVWKAYKSAEEAIQAINL